MLSVGMFFSTIKVNAQENVKIKFSGFVSANTMWDSRQVVSGRDGEVLLFPAPHKYDKNGNDINDVGSFNIITLHSRLKAQTTPFEVWDGKLTATLEFDFMGTTNDKKGLVRMRHAFLNYKKGKSSIIFGQYWHPIFIPQCFPTTASWNIGVPISTLSRNPQFRYTYNFTNDFRGSITALSQMDFASTGANGKSSEYIRNSSIPEFDIHLEYGNASKFLLGTVAGTKTLKPRLVNDKQNKVDEHITSFHAMAYATYKTPKMGYKLQGIYAENGYNLLLLGGYAVKNIDANDQYSYTPIAVSSIWGEIYSHYDSLVNFGLFAGYTKNLGAKDEVVNSKMVYARGANIADEWRIAPRVTFGYKKFKIMAEFSQTYANYGTPNKKMQVKNTDRVGNSRILLHIKYAF